MPRLFHDPTPRIERKDSLCTVVSVGAESTTHTGKTGVVSFRGRNYGATIIGTVAAGDQAHFIQTADNHVWAIQRGTYYRSAYPKLPHEWAKKSPASLAVLELMKGNPRDRVFRSGKIISTNVNSATLALHGKGLQFPAMFNGDDVKVAPSAIGKTGLVFENELVYNGYSRFYDNEAPWPDWYFKDSDRYLTDLGISSLVSYTVGATGPTGSHWTVPSVGFYSQEKRLKKARIKILTLYFAENYPSYSIEATRSPQVFCVLYKKNPDVGSLPYFYIGDMKFGTNNWTGHVETLGSDKFTVTEKQFQSGPSFNYTNGVIERRGVSTFTEIEVEIKNPEELGDGALVISIGNIQNIVNRYFLIGKDASNGGAVSYMRPYVNNLGGEEFILNMVSHPYRPDYSKNANCYIEW